MFYELRIYHVKPGCLAQLVNRFERTNVPMFNRLGIEYIGFWTVLVGQSNHDFHYMLKWHSLDERGKKWSAFVADPEWIATRDATDIGSPLVQTVTNTLLMATSFSPLK